MLAAKLAAAALALYALHRLGLWAEERGWIYYSHAGRPTHLAAALMRAAALLEPQKQHVQKARERREVQADAQGAPAEAGPVKPA